MCHVGLDTKINFRHYLDMAKPCKECQRLAGELIAKEQEIERLNEEIRGKDREIYYLEDEVTGLQGDVRQLERGV